MGEGWDGGGTVVRRSPPHPGPPPQRGEGVQGVANRFQSPLVGADMFTFLRGHRALLSVFLFLGFAASAAVLRAGDWPSFRGPDRSAVSKETGLLKEWPAEGPPLVWETKGAGRGYASL